MTEHQLGDQPIEPRYHEQMQLLARTLDRYFNEDLYGKDRHTGFVVLVFPFDGPKQGDARCNFISNGADRKDVVTLMKEMIARFEGQPEMKGQS
jgi:hypothetical protein